MLHTKEINNLELNKYLRWLDNQSSFRDSALKSFGNEINTLHQYNPLPNSTYYIVSDDDRNLLLIRTTLQTVLTGSSLALSFARVFNKTEGQHAEAHFWLKNALEEKIIAECIQKDVEYISIKAVTQKGEHILNLLHKLWVDGRVNVKKIKIHDPDPYGTFFAIYT